MVSHAHLRASSIPQSMPPQVDQLIKDLRRDIYARGDVADGTVDGSTKNFRIHLAALTETAVEIEFEVSTGKKMFVMVLELLGERTSQYTIHSSSAAVTTLTHNL